MKRTSRAFAAGLVAVLPMLAAPVATAATGHSAYPGIREPARQPSAACYAHVFHNIRYSNGNWQGYNETAEPPDTCFTDIAVASSGYDTHVDVVANAGLWDNVRHPDGSWQGWARPLQPYGAIQHLAEAGDVNGNIWFVASTTTGLYYTERLDDGSWHGWNPVNNGANPNSITDVAVTRDVFGHLQIAVVSGSQVWHNVLYGGWQGWALPAQIPGGTNSIAAAGQTNGEVQFIGVGLDGYVYHNIRYASGTWEGWNMPPQPPGAGSYSILGYNLGQVSAAVDGDGEAQFTVSAMSPSGYTTIYHTIRFPNGAWQSTWAEPNRSGISYFSFCPKVVVTTHTYTGGPYDFQFATICS